MRQKAQTWRERTRGGSIRERDHIRNDVFFIVEGVATIMYALEHRRELSGRWGWMLFSGLIDLVLAVMILAGLPGTAAWALGILVGVNMIFGGTALLAMGLHARGGAAR